jgi:hypothetical protein
MIAIFVVRCRDTIPAQNCINKFTFDVGMGWFENWDCGANFIGDIESRNYESEWCKSKSEICSAVERVFNRNENYYRARSERVV